MQVVVQLLLILPFSCLGSNSQGVEFLEANKKKEGVITLDSGLQYKVLRTGNGDAHPLVSSKCSCHYAGSLIDGTEFDSSYKRSAPSTFAPNQVIKGWTEALQLMVEGDKWELYIPSELAYGAHGRPPKIPGNSVLIFTIELLKIQGKSIPAARSCASSDRVPPIVDGASFIFIGGKKIPWNGPKTQVTSPVFDNKTGTRTIIGELSKMDADTAVEAAQAAKKAWDQGQGEWPLASLAKRISAIESYLSVLSERRTEIIETLMWEIAKNTNDATKEFDRTVAFAQAVIQSLRTENEIDIYAQEFTQIGNVRAIVKRGPIGITLMVAPFNYPLNEMYAMMIPALLTGNIVILKLPATGALPHILAIDALMSTLPKGVVNYVTGKGRETLPAIMSTGIIDALGFIGSSKGADALIKAHPHPHRLKVFSQLEGKNMGIVFPDADLDLTVKQLMLGALSYNGQRCTAIKLILVHDDIADALVSALANAIEALPRGLPWDEGVQITPLPDADKPAYLTELVQDAITKGAKIMNSRGAQTQQSLFHPALVAYLTPDMRLFHEEQFGPLVAVAKFSSIDHVIQIAKNSWSGQQVAIFTESDAPGASTLIDAFSTIVGRANINLQCSRGPDVLPFSGRRSSAMGTMSVTSAVRAFSVEVVVATHPKDTSLSSELLSSSKLLTSLSSVASLKN
uniref:peptidylprolyl isomerase n=1 Tax=Aureoumbra lagunensis TaxID=44058 RepID=A0A7S3JYG4_9STRA|mmetsp:Transcript_4270/g.5315  ORF Transcript_4270/g.5315 Transcript_4270/m.5315 type:complete len:684 (-) Transcript_4270:378-2429(-)